MPGTLIPPWFVRTVPTCHDVIMVSIIWGISLGLSAFGVIRAGSQTYHQYKRTRRVTTYMVLIWLELISSTIIGGISWGYVYLTIPPSFEFYFFLLVLWVFQLHCIMQIIVNRIALLSPSPPIICRLKWGVFLFLLAINISVFCIWIPARLQISQRIMDINNIWDRIEKGLCAILDLGLNFYFIYLVRSTLIAYGLTKYILLYRFNLFMISISISMDILIIAVMSLSNSFLYVLFHPLAYLVKLHIELWMAELIAKIVKASGPGVNCHCACHNTHFPLHPELNSISYPAPLPGAEKIAPTTGRLRRLWPISRRTRESEDGTSGHIHAPRRGWKKAARSEEARPRRVSRIPRCCNKDFEMGMSSLSSSMGRSSRRRSNDRQG